MSFRGYLDRHRRERIFKARFDTVFSSLSDNRFTCRWEDRWPCLDDATGTTGFDAHYVYHTAWAARILAQTLPARHTDISSCLRFATLVSAFIPVDFYDYRPAHITLRNLRSLRADITALPFADSSVQSLSCMHVVEHIGLERYGDPLDPRGDISAMKELKRVLAGGGQLLFVVPVGDEARIQYNAHRIYTCQQIREYFRELELASFAFVTDSGEFIANAIETDTIGQKYGCGCFHFIRRTS